jgi:hypothetical protein
MKENAMSDSLEDRVGALEARIQGLEPLVDLALRLLALDRPLSALLARYGASEAQDRAIHALLDDVIKRIEAGGVYAPAFSGFLSDLGSRFPVARNDRVFVSLFLDTLKVERPAYQKLHAYATAQGWPQWHT